MQLLLQRMLFAFHLVKGKLDVRPLARRFRLLFFMDTVYLQIIESNRVASATRDALLARAAQQFPNAPVVIDRNLYPVLQAVLGRLVPQSDRLQPIDLAGWLDYNLSCGRGNGWRYSDMPADGRALSRGLSLLDQSAGQSYGKPFVELTHPQMDHLLKQVQSGDICWQDLNAERWFEELLTDSTELFVSHPDTLEEIGFSGMAILPKWEHVGLDERESWEPEAHA